MFDRLYGNRRFKESLSELIMNGKLPQSLIIEGEKGTGRHIAAGYAAAAAVCGCDHPPCLQCNDCRLALKLQHPDIRVFTPEKKVFPVELARSVRSYAYIKPMTARTGVSVLERCDPMTVEAQNALLKVLEEPPEAAMFILLTENSDSFLPTVLSRCTVLTLEPVTEEEAFSCLSSYGKYSDDEIYRAVAVSEGNIGRALSALEGGKDYEYRSISDDIFTAFSENDAPALLRLAYKAEKCGDPEAVIRSLCERLHFALRDAATDKDVEAEAKYSAAFDAAVSAADALRSNGNRQLVLNILCSRLGKAAGR